MSRADHQNCESQIIDLDEPSRLSEDPATISFPLRQSAYSKEITPHGNPQPDRESAPSSHKDIAAVSDALNFLAKQDLETFRNWNSDQGHRFATRFRLSGYPVPVLEYVNWQLLDTEDTACIEGNLRRTIRNLVQTGGAQRDQFILHGDDLLVFQDTRRNQSAGFVIVVSPDALQQFLTDHFPAARLTPALLRLVNCYLSGLSLNDGAKIDGKSVETRKSQARELRRRLDVDRAEDVSRIIGSRLISAVSSMLSGGNMRDSETFEQYVSTYLPESVRSLVLLDRGHQPYRILDMGPKSGIPLITLHAMILPDIRATDIALLEELGLRLI